MHSEHEISQFADDTSVILVGSEESLNETLLELEWFKKISGLKINFSKTQVIWIGRKNTAVIDYVITGISPGEKLRLLFWE